MGQALKGKNLSPRSMICCLVGICFAYPESSEDLADSGNETRRLLLGGKGS